MTTFTTLADSTLAQDKPLTQSITRAFRDNLLAVASADSSAPRIVPSALNFPYFSAKRTTTQTFTGTQKVQCNTEDYDPDNLYDNATNYRFLPNKAGLYLFSGYADFAAQNITNGTVACTLTIKKNGTGIIQMKSPEITGPGTFTIAPGVLVSGILQMNGSTDYVELEASCVTGITAARFWGHAVCEI